MPDAHPRYAVSSCTTYHTTFEQDVKNCAQLGIGGIGVWEYKLPPGRDDENVALFNDNGLTATYCFPDVPSIIYGDPLFPEPKGRAERLELLKAGIRRLAKFRPQAICVLAGAQRDVERATAWSWAVDGLREAAHVAGEEGVRLVLEVIRPSLGGTLVGTIPQALDMISDMGVDNVDVLVDTFHSWNHPDFLDDVRAHVGRIGGVQVNDHPPAAAGFWDRAVPGAGDMNLAEILRTLREAGYDGWYEFELFSDDGTLGHVVDDPLWQHDPLEVQAAGRDGFNAVWERSLRP